MRLHVDAELLDPQYLVLVLGSPQLRNQIEIQARSTSGVHNINTQEVRGLAVALPPRAEQHEIVRRAQAMLAGADRLATQVEQVAANLDRISTASSAKAFRGELVRTEAVLADEDGRGFESAVELLARIESANTAAPPQRRGRVAS